LEGRLADYFFHFSTAEFAFGQGGVRNFLESFKYFTAFGTLIFVNRHLLHLRKYIMAIKYKVDILLCQIRIPGFLLQAGLPPDFAVYFGMSSICTFFRKFMIMVNSNNPEDDTDEHSVDVFSKDSELLP